MIVRVAQAMDKAHRFALWHRKRLEEPNRTVFLADWRKFSDGLKERGQDWTEIEYSIMLAYALAALHYDEPKGHRVLDWGTYRSGGLWRQQWGNVGSEGDDDEEAAA